MSRPPTAAFAGSRGIALASVLFYVLGALVLSATLFLSTWIDGQSTANVAAADDALFVAEAGLQHLWSALDPASDFARALAWPGGVPPFGSPVWFPRPPRTYRVSVAARADGALLASAEGTSLRGSRARLEGVFRREEPFRPAAALVVAEPLERLAITGGLAVDGSDGVGAEPPLVALGGESDAVGERLRAAAGALAPRVVGDSRLAAAWLRLRPTADRIAAGPFDDDRWGTPAAPAVVQLAGLADVSGEVSATGIVIADSTLRVTGRLRVEGLLLAAEGIAVDGRLEVDGALWVRRELAVGAFGILQARYSSAALGVADRLRPGELPRAAILGGWREVW
jgi:hypothetical protein